MASINQTPPVTDTSAKKTGRRKSDWDPIVQRYGSRIAAVIVSLSLIGIFQLFEQRLEAGRPDLSEPVESSEYSDDFADRVHRFSSVEDAAFAEIPDVTTGISFDPDVTALLIAKQFDRVREILLNRAMTGVRLGDEAATASTMTQLGMAALEEGDYDTAEVYLQEALAIFELLGDQAGIADTSLHMGRMHLLERRQARRAAYAYDAGLIARWYVARGEFDLAEPILKRAVDDNLALNRHGAAAADYEMLYQGYLQSGTLTEAREAAIEAALLNAASGRPDEARLLLDDIEASGISYETREQLRYEINAQHADYEYSVGQMGRARDYNQLYHHYIAEGDPVRAWQFRLQANASLNQASKRARYRRQAGVLVLLYNSNSNMKNAEMSLTRAHTTYETIGEFARARQAQALMNENY